MIALLLLLYRQNDELKKELMISNQNQIALTDSIKIVKGKLGDVSFLKASFIASGEDLKKLNRDLYEEVKRLEGNVKVVQRSISTIKSDPIVITNKVTQFPDGMTELSWKFDTTYNDNNSRLLSGSSKFFLDSLGRVFDRGTTITKDEIKISLLTGLTQENGVYKIFVNTKYPNFKVDRLEGSILDQNLFVKSQEDNYIFGPQLGLGFGSDFKPQIYLGFGVTYNINKQIKKLFRK